ncbi:hypothetical protein ACFVVC_14615 [Pseudarthrobacter sp. NPDC058196]|uniref:hypothetical protein n=1 Tax=Pseudarthrobacter sp. NPDC058196 TaxID=3346376 RepID=UPI0036D7DEF8
MTPPSSNLASLVDDMLEDAGCGDDHELRATLLSLGALASLPAPAPGGELAALLAPAGPPAVGDTVEHPPAREAPDDDLARRRRRRHRPTALGLVLVAGMGLGVGGVAASSTVPGGGPVQQLVAIWTPPWSPPSTTSASAAGGGYRSPAIAADGEVPGPVSSASSAAAAQDGSHASRHLEGSAGVAGRGGRRSCGGPSTHDDGSGPGACVPAPPGAAFPAAPGGVTDGNGRSRSDSGAPPAADAAPSGAPGTGKQDAPGAITPAGGQDGPGAAAPKSAAAPAPAVQAPGQGSARTGSPAK